MDMTQEATVTTANAMLILPRSRRDSKFISIIFCLRTSFPPSCSKSDHESRCGMYHHQINNNVGRGFWQLDPERAKVLALEKPQWYTELASKATNLTLSQLQAQSATDLGELMEENADVSAVFAAWQAMVMGSAAGCLGPLEIDG